MGFGTERPKQTLYNKDTYTLHNCLHNYAERAQSHKKNNIKNPKETL